MPSASCTVQHARHVHIHTFCTYRTDALLTGTRVQEIGRRGKVFRTNWYVFVLCISNDVLTVTAAPATILAAPTVPAASAASACGRIGTISPSHSKFLPIFFPLSSFLHKTGRAKSRVVARTGLNGHVQCVLR